MVQYKAVITDLDGTALNSPIEKTVSKRLMDAVTALELKGIKVCAATGRSETFAKPVLVSMGLRHPVIISGGARIIDPISGYELWSCNLSATHLKMIIEALKDTPYGFLWNDSTEEDYLQGGWPIKEFTGYESTYFIEACFVPHEEVKRLIKLLNAIEGLAITVVTAQRPGMNDIHITDQGATKEHAIYQLEKIINVPKNEMIGVGDGHNDFHIFRAVGYKVAVGNAVPELQEAADKIIGNVNEDGLAKYFEDLLVEGKR